MDAPLYTRAHTVKREVVNPICNIVLKSRKFVSVFGLMDV
jgi:hypothetical protein